MQVGELIEIDTGGRPIQDVIMPLSPGQLPCTPRWYKLYMKALKAAVKARREGK